MSSKKIKKRLSQEHRTLGRHYSWVNLARQISLVMSFVLPVCASILWYYATDLGLSPIELWLAWGGLALGALFFLVLAMMCPAALHLLRQHEMQLQLEFDVAQAVSDTLWKILQRVVPSYQKTSGQIHIGTELLRAVKLESDRAHELTATLEKIKPELEQAATIIALINELAAKNGSTTATVEELQAVADAFTNPKVVSLTPPKL